MKLESFKKALEEKPLFGFASTFPVPGIIELVGPDWDWCWIDTQHGDWNINDVANGVRACNLLGKFALIRAMGKEPGIIGKILDTACNAIMIPMVNNREQAEAIVDATRYAPTGHRSYGGRRTTDMLGRAFVHGEQPLVVCQIESIEAVENVDAIASTKGIDALFFGPDDLALGKGMRMDNARPADCFKAELIAVAEAARRHGKIAGGVFPLTGLKQAFDLGFHLVACVSDVSLMMETSRQKIAFCHSELENFTLSKK